jgi:MOSC domain-containing protein YiiM
MVGDDDTGMAPGTATRGRVESVNIGTPRWVEYRRRREETSIWKTPVEGRVPVRGVHIGDDVQADTGVHGGPSKAVYAYAVEDLARWGERLGRELNPGTFGENLTVSGLDVSHAVVGEEWKIGSAVLRVTEPRLPCFKLGIRMGDARFPKRFGKAALFGAYCGIAQEGELEAGDVVEVVARPAHGVTVSMMGRFRLGEWELGEELLRADALPVGWRLWIESVVEARNAG